jgi:hypothetical protein
MMVTADHTAGRIVASEHAGGPGQIPSRGEQQRDWPRQRRARTVRGKIGFGQRPDGEVAPPPIRQTLLERVIDLPWHTGSVQNQDLCALATFRSRPVLPIAIAGIEPAGMRGQETHLGTAREAPRRVARARPNEFRKSSAQTCAQGAATVAPRCMGARPLMLLAST